MTKDQILKDLDYASSLAREGASTPLLGGRIGLMWGILLSVTLSLQWAIISQTIAIPLQNLMYLWIAFAVIGTIGNTLIGRQIDKRDGAQSAANKVERYVWIMFAGMLGSLFIGIVINISIAGGSPELFGLMTIVGFGGQGLAYGVVALMSKIKWIHMASFASFIASILCFSVYNSVELYLIGGIACLFTIVLPSLISIRKETQHG